MSYSFRKKETEFDLENCVGEKRMSKWERDIQPPCDSDCTHAWGVGFGVLTLKD